TLAIVFRRSVVHNGRGSRADRRRVVRAPLEDEREAMITTSAGPADSLTAAATSGQGVVAWYAQGFSDRLGDRLLLFDNTGAPPLELLRLAERLTTHDGFEPALRDQVERLKPLRHPAFARVRGVTVLSEPVPQLALVSEPKIGRAHVRTPVT